jgi:hypothetical protein
LQQSFSFSLRHLQFDCTCQLHSSIVLYFTGFVNYFLTRFLQPLKRLVSLLKIL